MQHQFKFPQLMQTQARVLSLNEHGNKITVNMQPKKKYYFSEQSPKQAKHKLQTQLSTTKSL
jgi:hypothetical protein